MESPIIFEVRKENNLSVLSVIGVRVCEFMRVVRVCARELDACLHGRKDSDRQAE